MGDSRQARSGQCRRTHVVSRVGWPVPLADPLLHSQTARIQRERNPEVQACELERVHIHQQILNLLVRERLAEAVYFALSMPNGFADAIIVGGKLAERKVGFAVN